MNIEYLVEEGFDGMTVENFLLKEKKISRRLLTKLKRIENGITLDGEHIRSVDKVKANSILSIFMNDEEFLEPNGELFVEVVYEDENVVVFNKPPFMPCHPSHLHQGDTLGNFFAFKYKDKSFRPINRLDRDTSGLCVVAKDSHSANKLQRSLDKTYMAVVCGVITESGEVELPIARENNSIIKRVVSPDGQYARTKFEPILNNGIHTLLKIKLETGRTHQIRVHMSAIGYPLAGDDMYGGDKSMNRQALHCAEISFLHPVSDKRIELKCPLPSDIEKIIK